MSSTADLLQIEEGDLSAVVQQKTVLDSVHQLVVLMDVSDEKGGGGIMAEKIIADVFDPSVRVAIFAFARA